MTLSQVVLRQKREAAPPAALLPVQPRFKVFQLIGTRTGWAMRVVYVLSDLVAFACSLAVARLAVDLVRGAALASFPSTDLKLYLLWTIGLVIVASATSRARREPSISTSRR